MTMTMTMTMTITITITITIININTITNTITIALTITITFTTSSTITTTCCCCAEDVVGGGGVLVTTSTFQSRWVPRQRVLHNAHWEFLYGYEKRSKQLWTLGCRGQSPTCTQSRPCPLQVIQSRGLPTMLATVGNSTHQCWRTNRRVSVKRSVSLLLVK